MSGTLFHFCRCAGGLWTFQARAEILGDNAKLLIELDALEAEVARMENLTKRMSDEYLDLDLLDQQARDILGYIGSNDIVIR